MFENPIDQLFDEENNDPIVLYNEKGEAVTFEQIALIPMGQTTYAILKPNPALEGMGEDEGLVFAIVERDGEEVLELQLEDSIIDGVFAIYEEALAEEG